MNGFKFIQKNSNIIIVEGYNRQIINTIPEDLINIRERQKVRQYDFRCLIPKPKPLNNNFLLSKLKRNLSKYSHFE